MKIVRTIATVATVLAFSVGLGCKGKKAGAPNAEKICDHMLTLMAKEAKAEGRELLPESLKSDRQQCIDGAKEEIAKNPENAEKFSACVLKADSFKAALDCDEK